MVQETRSSLDPRVSETIPEEGTSHHDYQVLTRVRVRLRRPVLSGHFYNRFPTDPLAAEKQRPRPGRSLPCF